MGFLISLKRKFRQFKKFFQDHQQAFNFIIVFLFFAIVGPLGINQIFYRPPVFPIFKVSWEIGDALSYYGVLVAAVATIVGVYVSIGAAQRSYHEDEINRVKPYIALTGYRTACKVQLFCLAATRTLPLLMLIISLHMKSISLTKSMLSLKINRFYSNENYLMSKKRL